MEGILRVCAQAALEAGDIIMDFYSLPLEERGLSYKEDQSPVTKADQAANDWLIRRIQDSPAVAALGDYGILAEESQDDPSRLEKEWCFIIDPLDGTKEFVAGLPEFTVNIALTRNGEPVLGVVYAPATRELFYAVQGRGAYKCTDPLPDMPLFLPKHRIFVSSRTDNLVAMHSRFHLDDKTKSLLDRHHHRFASVTTAGSSLKVCRIAEGIADIYYRFGYTMEWDTCAEQIVVTEAGGFLCSGGENEAPLRYNRVDSCNREGFYVVNRMENRLEGVSVEGV